MEEFDLIQKVRAGEIEAFEKWMDIYSVDIECFAVQYGCSLKQAGEVAEETFRNLHNQLDSLNNEESLVCALYINALTSVKHVQQADRTNEMIFPFEEDQELRDQIAQLGTAIKVPFILSRFHKLTDFEIAAITDTSVEIVERAIIEASHNLEVAQLDKKLEFLYKSYGRITSSFRKEQVLAKPQKEIQATGKLKQTLSKKAIISWIAGVLVLLILVAVPVVTGEEYKKASAERYIERLKATFEKEIDSRYIKLGLTKLTEKDRIVLGHNMFDDQAREEFEAMTSRYERVIAETGTLNKKKINEEYKEILKTVELPSEMAEQLVKNSHANEKVKSEEFIKDYLKQYDIIQQAYYMIFIKHEQVITDAIGSEGRSLEKFMEKKDTYPEDLQKALDGMIKQNIYPTFINEWGIVSPSYGSNDFSAKIRSSIHKDLGGFFTLLESGPFVSYPGLSHSLNDSVDYLLDMEKTLMATTMDDEKTYMLGGAYSELFYEIIGGEDPDSILGTDGKVKKEFRKAWKRIESAEEESPSAYFMKMINNEMKAGDWTGSESRNRFQPFQLKRALKLTKSGELDTSKKDGINKPETDIEMVSFPNHYFEKTVRDTYYSFSSKLDQSVLQGVSPLVILGVYFFANDQEDPETMWHLYSETQISATLEEFTEEWRPLDMDIFSLDSLNFNGIEEVAGSIGFYRGNEYVNGAQMVLNNDLVWEIDHIDLDMLLVE